MALSIRTLPLKPAGIFGRDAVHPTLSGCCGPVGPIVPKTTHIQLRVSGMDGHDGTPMCTGRQASAAQPGSGVQGWAGRREERGAGPGEREALAGASSKPVALARGKGPLE